MKGKQVSLLAIFIILAMSGSCIFQNEPLKPNTPPVIESFSPAENDLYAMAPADIITFTLSASDADRDELTYEFYLSDTCNASLDSLVGTSNQVDFTALKGGRYCMQGRVRDGVSFAYRNWYITVIEETNEPPVIVSSTPALDSLTTVLGQTIEFRIGAQDERPEFLRYAYYINGEQVRPFYSSAVFSHRFIENGRFDVMGVIHDYEYYDSLTWYINVVGDPDTILPGAIFDLEGWTGELPGTIDLRWTAPGDDEYEGRSQAYVVKTATVPILDEDDWDEASQKFNTPEPGISGSIDEMTVFNCYPGTFLYATIRAIDDFGNLGPMGNCILLLVRGYDASGIVYDAATGLPVAGAEVSAGMINDISGSDGSYILENLPKYAQLIRVYDEDLPGERGQYYDLAQGLSELTGHFELDLPMLPVLGMVSCYPENPRYDDFLVFLKDMTGTTGLLGRSTVYRGWRKWPLKVYNPPMEWETVDLQAEARGAMAAWEDGTGLDLFVEVDSPVDCDVEIVYFGTGDDKHKAKVISTYEDGAPKKKEIWIYLNNMLSPIWVQGHMIFAHELGHILGVLHSVDFGHLMVGNTAPLVDDPTTDELNLSSTIYWLPPTWDSDMMEND